MGRGRSCTHAQQSCAAARASASVPISSITMTSSMVLHRLDHHAVLQLGTGNLQAPCPANRWSENVAIASNLIAGVNHHHTPAQVISQHPGDFTQCRGLPTPGRPRRSND